MDVQTVYKLYLLYCATLLSVYKLYKCNVTLAEYLNA